MGQSSSIASIINIIIGRAPTLPVFTWQCWNPIPIHLLAMLEPYSIHLLAMLEPYSIHLLARLEALTVD